MLFGYTSLLSEIIIWLSSALMVLLQCYNTYTHFKKQDVSQVSENALSVIVKVDGEKKLTDEKTTHFFTYKSTDFVIQINKQVSCNLSDTYFPVNYFVPKPPPIPEGHSFSLFSRPPPVA